MKTTAILITLAGCLLIAAPSRCQTSPPKAVMQKNVSIASRKFAPGTVGEAMQHNMAAYNRLTPVQKASIDSLGNQPWATLTISPSMKCFLYPQTCGQKVTMNDFAGLHPCGVAISPKGMVAVSTYEGDNTNGSVFVWTSYSDFAANQPSAYKFEFKDPEAVAFDAKGQLYIASTSTGTIYKIYSVGASPMIWYYRGAPDQHDGSLTIDDNTSAPANWNPRQMSIDASGNVYVMCENLYPNPHPSKVLRLAARPGQAWANPARGAEVTGLQPLFRNALGVALQGGRMAVTDLDPDGGFANSTVKVYDYNTRTDTASNPRTLLRDDGTGTGGALDVALSPSGSYAYFTNASGYLIRWDYSRSGASGLTKNIRICTPDNSGNTSWGIAIYNGDIVVANAIDHRVEIHHDADFH